MLASGIQRYDACEASKDEQEKQLTYQAFLNNHLKPNIPCIFGPALVSDWLATSEWVAQSESDIAAPRWSLFLQRFGQDNVSVAHCQSSEFGDHRRLTMSLADLVAKWIPASSPPPHAARDPLLAIAQGLYLKDWHLRLRYPDYEFYSTPDCFRDDWMNDYYVNARCGKELDDFRFVYMGLAGTFTPLHRDVYCSYSWSTNIVGQKRWTLFPPSVTEYLYASKERVFDVRDVNLERFPGFPKALQQAIVLVQQPGETIFVPSGWYHQVENLTACISINHNWANANSLGNMYHAMCEELKQVEEALSDVREMIRGGEGDDSGEWQQQWTFIVQDVLEKNSGWGWLDFWSMVLHAVNSRFKPVSSETSAWPSAPISLRTPWDDESATIKDVLHKFRADRPSDIKWIPELLTVLENLEKLLHVYEQTQSN